MKGRSGESNIVSVVFAKLPNKISIYFTLVAYALALYSFVPSAVGHFYYDQNNYNKAIYWDKNQPLYYLVRGTQTMATDLKSSVEDFKKTIELSPGLGYAYGFLAGAQIGLKENPAAQKSIAKAMALSGGNAYWHLIAAIANFKDQETFTKHLNKAVKLNPQILSQVRDPQKAASIYIGGNNSDVRVLGFYRKGPKLFLPLPYIPNCPYNHEVLRQRLLWEDKQREQE